MKLAPKHIANLVRFHCDLDDALPDSWKPGALLVKGPDVLAGTTESCKPSSCTRVTVFARHAALAGPDVPDPWHIAAVDRNAAFVVAARHEVGACTHVALVELSDRQLGAPPVISAELRVHLHSTFEESRILPAFRFARDTIYLKVATACNTPIGERLHEAALDEAQREAISSLRQITGGVGAIVKMGFATATAAPAPASAADASENDTPAGDVQFETNEGAMPAPPADEPQTCEPAAEPENAHDAPGEAASDEAPASKPEQAPAPVSGQEPVAERITDDSASHADASEDDELSDASWIVALAESILSESAAQSYLAANESSMQRSPDGATTAPEASAAAHALYDSLHVEPAPHAAPAGTGDGQQPEEQASSAATALYETLHHAEACLDDLPAYTPIPTPNGLEFLQASCRSLAAHPALEYEEAQRNFARLLQRQLDRILIKRLYAGKPEPATEQERIAEGQRLWFDPLAGCDFAPILSEDASTYLDNLRLSYLDRLPAQAPGSAPSAAVEQMVNQLALVSDAINGDLHACAALIDKEVRAVQLPYRYQFSVSFDIAQRTALVNLFLPQKALFPLAMKADEADMMHSASGFNRRYQNAACALGVMTLALVKMHAPWIQDLALNAWYRTPEQPQCVFTLRTDERTLAELCTNDTNLAFQALKSMKARIHSGNHHELLPLEPTFPLYEGLDMMFGFKAFANGWTFPPTFCAIGSEPDEQNLAHTIDMVNDMLAQGMTTQAYRAARAREQGYRQRWLDGIEDGVHALSCDNELEERVCLAMLAGERVHLLPRKLGQLYHVLGAIAASMGVVAQARIYLDRAISLNPACALSLLELSNVAAAAGEIEEARTLVERASAVAYSPYSVAQTLKQQGWLAAHDGDYEAAYYLYCYSLALYDSESHKALCHERIGALLHVHEQKTGRALRAAGETSIANLDTSVAWLNAHGWHTGIGEACWNIAKAPVEQALSGGPLPNACYVEAYMTGLHATSADNADVRSLILNVYEVRFGDFPFSDYLHKPILLTDSDIVYTLDAHVGLAPDEPGRSTGIAAIPYIDPHMGLMLQVLGSIDLQTRETARVLPEHKPLKLPAAPYRDTPFLLLRPCDYPDLPIESHALNLARDYAVSQERDATRGRRDIDLLRDFGNPDDVLVLLAGKGLRPEAVWGRLERVDRDGTLFARLENEPYDDFGVHAGDVCPLILDADPESGLVLAYAGRPRS